MPDADYVGEDSFTYAILNYEYYSIATATITVSAAPVAEDDAATVDQDGTLTVLLPGVLGNDWDVEDDELTAVLVSQTEYGELALNEDGSFTYAPEEGFYGEDEFTYQAFDGHSYSNVATVTITVNAIPVAVDDTAATNENTPLTTSAPGVLFNDSDAEEGALTAVLESGTSHGALTLNPDGSFSYTPVAGFHGGRPPTASDGDACRTWPR